MTFIITLYYTYWMLQKDITLPETAILYILGSGIFGIANYKWTQKIEQKTRQNIDYAIT